jgi:hypothetical protein
MKIELAINALYALREYNHGKLPTDYDDFAIIFVDFDENNKAIWAVTKIIDEWKPREVSDRIRKFTEEVIYSQDSYASISFDD